MINLTEIGFFLLWINLTLRTKISEYQQAVTSKLGPNICSMSSNA